MWGEGLQAAAQTSYKTPKRGDGNYLGLVWSGVAVDREGLMRMEPGSGHSEIPHHLDGAELIESEPGFLPFPPCKLCCPLGREGSRTFLHLFLFFP